ncbi:MAG: thioredoxin domain-containing protein, partial [Conexibacteraceae bacterium]|nr:thioredoxin domain-containing protein [Conexibacteraceae bacterium]
EGKFYVWSVDELRETLGDELAEPAIAYFGLTGTPNFEGHAWVLEAHGEPPAELLPEIRASLFAARSERVRPGLDDKRLTAWNALMIAALADAGAALEREDYVQAACDCAGFVLDELRDADGNLLRTWKDGRASIPAYLEDHAFLLQALLVLYEASFDERWYVESVALADAMIERFGDPEQGGFFTTAAGLPHLVGRRKDLDDTPIPSGNSAAALGLLRLARISGEAEYERQAAGVLALHAPIAARHPLAFGHLLQALDLYLATPREVAIVGAGPLTGALRTRYRPHIVLAGTDRDTTDGTAVPLLEGRTTVAGQQAAYVCERFACQLPITDLEALEASLDGRA